LRAPETAESEHGLLEALRVRRLQRASVDEMARGSRDRRGAARQCLGRTRQRGGLAHEKHGLPPGGTSGRGANGPGRVTSIYVFTPALAVPLLPVSPGNSRSGVF